MKKLNALLIAAGTAAAAVGVAPQLLFRDGTPASASPAPGAPPVEVAKPEVRSLVESADFLGRIEAFEAVEIKARVSGVIDQVAFREGEVVREGDLLFRIDPRPYRMALEQAEANLLQKQEQLKLAESRRKRTVELVERTVASRDALDAAIAHEAALSAEVRAAQAAVAAAKLDLEFTEIRAPISGRIGAAKLTRGNHVTAAAGGGVTLANIVAVDRVKVVFDLDESRYLSLLAKRGMKPGQNKLQVAVGLTTDSDRPLRGEVDFVDVALDRDTGTMRARAILPNPDGTLAPGLFARVRLELGGPREVLLVDEKAVAAGATGRLVLVVGQGDVVEARPITLGATPQPGKRVVLSGLDANDRIVMKGYARPGMKVSPVATVASAGSQQ